VTELDGSEVDYSYDALYRLTGETRTGTGAYTRSYGYDLAGNLTTYGGSTFASYDNTNKISSLSGGSISYDADGNTAAVSASGIPSTTLTWDVRSKLLRLQDSSTDLSYKYDHTGKRVLRWPTGSSAQQTFYVFAEDMLIGEIHSSSPAYAYTWGSGALISLRAIGSNQSFWQHFGPQSETRQLTDGTGAVSDSYRYDAYGRLLYSSGTHFNPFRYAGSDGYYTEDTVNVSLATNRWYSPDLSGWLSRDPIEYAGGDNLYAYASSNPVSYTDPDGLTPKGERGATGGGGAGQNTNYPGKHCKEFDPPDPRFVQCKDHQTGKKKKVPRPENMPYPTPSKMTMCEASCQQNVGGAALAGGAVYLGYRCARMLPSLFPPLWPTIPANAAIP
jgi:RHS repeat-associated protein